MSDTNIKAVGCKQYSMAKEPRDNSSYNIKELTIFPADLDYFINIKIVIFNHNFDFIVNKCWVQNIESSPVQLWVQCYM